ncbi:hypothetical protein NA57DRAFT_57024 [Rhizodiscina lignyota]|uniref:Uncharacterized protein n=1 Tax=Rhizodiscina lignyota TaxID=1504668 RepID=A0A9P4IGN0_9PEZI|nr:hypothetical protein NA57DRAFT_57024 [Rhizodiscina lignyota]
MADEIRFVRLISDSGDELNPEPSMSSIEERRSDSSSYDCFEPSFGTHRRGLEIPAVKEFKIRSSTSVAREPQAPSTSTADIAFFLKHTGPPSGHNAHEAESAPKAAKTKSSLALFKRRKGGESGSARSKSNSIQNRDSRITSGSLKVVEKTSTTGKKYYQIMPTDEYPDLHSMYYGTHRQNTSRLSTPFSERTATVNTDALDSWIANLGTSRWQNDTHQRPNRLRSMDTARASSRLLGKDDNILSSSDWVLPETSWAVKVLEEEKLRQARDKDIQGRELCQVQTSSSVPDERLSIELPDERRMSFVKVMDAALKDFSVDASSHQRNSNTADRLLPVNEYKPLSAHHKLTDFAEAPEAALSSASTTDTACQRREEAGQGAIFNTRTSREEKARTRKIRDLNQAKRDGKDARVVVEVEPKVRLEALTLTDWQTMKDDHRDMRLATLPSNLRPNSSQHKPSTVSQEARTEGTFTDAEIAGLPHTQSLKGPVEKGRRARRPPRLVLPARIASQQLAIAVGDGTKTGVEARASKIPEEEEAPVTQLDNSNSNRPFDSRELTKEPRDSTDRVSNVPRKGLLDHWESAAQVPVRHVSVPTGPPSSSQVVGEATTMRRALTAPNRTLMRQSAEIVDTADSTQLTLRLGQFPAPPIQMQRSSIGSSLTSASKETRLEARVESLERENKLLEAALMAVLKTGGKLNGCPCSLAKGKDEEQEHYRGMARKRKGPLSMYLETRSILDSPSIK